jgi:nitrous oxide reductase accessory protein NosL
MRYEEKAMRPFTKFIAILGIILTFSGCSGSDKVASGGPIPAANGIGRDLSMRPEKTDRCPVCAMATHDKKLPAAISLNDDRTFYFCGPGCMIRAWLDPKEILGVGKADLKQAVATEFMTGKSIDANNAVWVLGSDVKGPMGPMPVPLSKENVDAFKKRHGSTRTFSLGEMTKERWQTLRKEGQ